MIKISVVVATYATPPEGLQRVLDSLEAQSLPTEEFEAVFVDDGSPDDTYERLQELARTRPWMRVFRIPASGWGSAPRNEGTRQARGEYVLYMDHDDSLYPDALRSLWEFAHEHGSDLVSPKESKTNDTWWGLNAPWWPDAPVASGDLVDVRATHGFHEILPLVPHKLYRRQMLLDNDIWFPEGSRVLWEDQFFNIAAYRHARVVSVEATNPVYLWHASDSNSSHTFDPSRADFWEMLDRLLAFTVETFDGDDLAPERDYLLAQQARVRIIDRAARLQLLADAGTETKEAAFGSARRLLGTYVPEDVWRRLPQKHRVQAQLLAADERELFAEHHRADVSRGARAEAGTLRWEGTRLVIPVELHWYPKDPLVPAFVGVDGRVEAAVPTDLRDAVPASEWDITEDVRAPIVQVLIRDRDGAVSWELPVTVLSSGYREPGGVGEVLITAEAVLDADAVQAGRPWESGVWDVRWSSELSGMIRRGVLTYYGANEAFALGSSLATAYRNASGSLTIDSSGQQRTVAVDAGLGTGQVGSGGTLEIPLRRLRGAGRAERPAGLVLVPADQATGRRLDTAQGIDLHARVNVDGDEAKVLADIGELADGSYALYAERRGALHRTSHRLELSDGNAVLR